MIKCCPTATERERAAGIGLGPPALAMGSGGKGNREGLIKESFMGAHLSDAVYKLRDGHSAHTLINLTHMDFDTDTTTRIHLTHS